MTAATNYTINKFLVDNLLRGQTNAIPSTLYYALYVANRGYWAASTAYSVGDAVLPATPNGHIYRCTVAGTSGSTTPNFAGTTTAGATLVDNTVTWTEQTIQMLNGTFTEATYTGYARQSVASSLTNWAGTQGTGTTTASTGSAVTGSTSNNTVISYGAPTSNQAGVLAGMYILDAATSGNVLFWCELTNPKTVNNGDASPNFPAATFVLTWS